MYWCVDLETKVWYSRTKSIQFVQSEINQLLPQIMKSLLPYILVTRGPFVALAFYIAARWLHKQYTLFNIKGRCLVMAKYAEGISSGTSFGGSSVNAGLNVASEQNSKVEVPDLEAATSSSQVLSEVKLCSPMLLGRGGPVQQ